MGKLRRKLWVTLISTFLCALLILVRGFLQGPSEDDSSWLGPWFHVDPPAATATFGVVSMGLVQESGQAVGLESYVNGRTVDVKSELLYLSQSNNGSFGRLFSMLAIWDHWSPFAHLFDTLPRRQQSMNNWFFGSRESMLSLLNELTEGPETTFSRKGTEGGTNVKMVIGVLSANKNFDRRIGIRKTWMESEDVRSGKVVVRFFVELHSSKEVNNQIWNEAVAHGDIQLLPFVADYNLLALKTLAICIYAAKLSKPDFMMKTDDDMFVRVDKVLSAATCAKGSNSMLYGKIELQNAPQRDIFNKWYVSEKEFPYSMYPPWAHGLGYVISLDIVNFIVKSLENKSLEIFKLEDVAMGIWIEKFKESNGLDVDYINDDNFFATGCKDGFLVVHDREPEKMICMWNKLIEGNASCCD